MTNPVFSCPVRDSIPRLESGAYPAVAEGPCVRRLDLRRVFRAAVHHGNFGRLTNRK